MDSIWILFSRAQGTEPTWLYYMYCSRFSEKQFFLGGGCKDFFVGGCSIFITAEYCYHGCLVYAFGKTLFFTDELLAQCLVSYNDCCVFGKDVMYAYVDMLDFKGKDIVVALRLGPAGLSIPVLRIRFILASLNE